jgi:hypothetical protein
MKPETDIGSLAVLSPKRTRVSWDRKKAPRLSGFNGVTVGLLDNNKPGATVILKHLGELLRERGAGEVVYWRKSLPSGPSPYVKEAGTRCDLVISGLGDCGSCSSWSLRDALEVELLGRPTVTLVSEPFKKLIHVEAEALGIPDLPVLTVPHPVATRTDAELTKWADGLFESVVKSLVVS